MNQEREGVEPIAVRHARAFDPVKQLRTLSPEEFSDSLPIRTLTLPRAVLEYHLDSLTSRKQETDFEHFCRKLLEKEICPNLIVQTGPTGGGDSKVDTETYPVSDEVSLRWLVPEARAAGQERWAFAISAKKRFADKARSDVMKIAQTGRNYTRIYFVTNQLVPDRIRAELQDSLNSATGAGITVLDRAWIIERVYSKGHLSVAIETLHLEEFSDETHFELGPRDLERQREIEELDGQIADPSRYRLARVQLAEDCLRTAVLARGLERPRHEVEGRFERAARVAKEATVAERLRVAYVRAWTAAWFYDDAVALTEYYDDVERLTRQTSDPDDLERLFGLCLMLARYVKVGKLTVDAGCIESRLKLIEQEFERIRNDALDRPFAALRARNDQLLIRILLSADEERPVDALLDELWRYLAEIKQIDYPLTFLRQAVESLSKYLVNSSAYDRVFEALADILAHRKLQHTLAESFIERSHQKLTAKLPYDALGLLERALVLDLEDSDFNLRLRALSLSSIAYERIGLWWAARRQLLQFLNLAKKRLQKDHRELLRAHALCLRSLSQIELRLGRVLPALDWMASLLKASVQSLEPDEDLADYWQQFDCMLAALLARLEYDALSSVGVVPPILAKLQLEYSLFTLMYLLGYEYQSDEVWRPAAQNAEGPNEFLQIVASSLLARVLPKRVCLLDAPWKTLQTTLLGCSLTITAHNDPVSVGLAESLLSGLEAVLARHIGRHVATSRSTLDIACEPIKQGEEPGVQDQAEGCIRVCHPFTPENLAPSQLCDFVHRVVTRAVNEFVVFLDNTDVTGLGTSLSQTSLSVEPILMPNIMGVHTRSSLASCGAQHPEGDVPRCRDSPWEAVVAAAAASEIPVLPQEHERERLMLVSPVLWKQAGWREVKFFPDTNDGVPIITLAFAYREATLEIFKRWREKLGTTDANRALRVSVVRNIDSSEPRAFKFGVAHQIDSRVFGFMSYRCGSSAEELGDLDKFLDRMKLAGRYRILPVSWPDGERGELLLELAIEKEDLIVLEAREVTDRDPERCIL